MKSNLLIQLLKLVIYSEQNFMSYRQVNSHPKKIQSKNVAKKFSEYWSANNFKLGFSYYGYDEFKFNTKFSWLQQL
jgi:hypothetical protein